MQGGGAARKGVSVPDYSFLEDQAERDWLIGVDPAAVRDNAHRIYDFMAEGGMAPDSFTRELAFEKAAEALGINYDVLYNAWLYEVPVRFSPASVL